MGKDKGKKVPDATSSGAASNGSVASGSSSGSTSKVANVKPPLRLPVSVISKANRDFERMFSYVPTLKEMFGQVMLLRGEERTEMIFKTLKRLEHYMGAERVKLKRLPKRATKYVRGIRKITAMSKLAMAFMADESEAYPTLGMILVHWLDILLDSSWNSETQAPKTVASTAYGFMKYMFDDEIEFVLDVVLTSIADKAAAEKNSIGYHIFVAIVRDIDFYIDKSSTLAKYCAIAGLLPNLNPIDGKDIVRKAIQSCSRIPADFQTYLEAAYCFRPHARSTVITLSSVIERLDYRLVANNSRRRLVIIESKGKRGKSVKKKKNLKRSSSASSGPKTDDNQGCFFLDTIGNLPNDVPLFDRSALKDLQDDEDEEALPDFMSAEASLNPDVKSSENESSSLPSLHSEIGTNCNEIDSANEQNDENEYDENGEPEMSGSENFEDKLIQFDDMYERRDLPSTGFSDPELVPVPAKHTKPAKEVTEKPQPLSDSDIEVLMEDIIENPCRDEMDPFDGEGEKDEADPESGESDVPVYDQSYYMRAVESSSQSSELSEDENKKAETETATDEKAKKNNEEPMKSDLTEKSKKSAPGNINQATSSTSTLTPLSLQIASTETAKSGYMRSLANKKISHVDMNSKVVAGSEDSETSCKESDSQSLKEAFVNLNRIGMRAKESNNKGRSTRNVSPRKVSETKPSSLAVDNSKTEGRRSENEQVINSNQSTNDSEPKTSSPVKSPNNDVVSQELPSIPPRALRKRVNSASSADTNSSVRRSSRLASKDPNEGTTNRVDDLLAKLEQPAISTPMLSTRKRNTRNSVIVSSTMTVEKTEMSSPKSVKPLKLEPAETPVKPKRQKKSVEEVEEAPPIVPDPPKPQPKVKRGLGKLAKTDSPSQSPKPRSQSASASSPPPTPSRSSRRTSRRQ